ncbi:MAG: hypothetical protein ACYDAG_00710 [Chloroflexota bacterium]
MAAPLMESQAPVIEPPTRGWSAAFPVVGTNPEAPPLSRQLPRDPLLLAGFPGFIEGLLTADDNGDRIPKHDTVVLKGTEVSRGTVKVPAGGLQYMADTLRGTRPLLGQSDFILGRRVFLVDQVVETVLQENLELLPGRDHAVIVGDQMYSLGVFPPFQKFRNAVVHIGTVSGINWSFAAGSPASFPLGEDAWFSSTFRFAYNQGRAGSVSPSGVTLDFLTGTHLRQQTFADELLLDTWLGPGEIAEAPGVQVRVLKLAASPASAELNLVVDGSQTVVDLGPFDANELLPEDRQARLRYCHRYGDVFVEAPYVNGPIAHGKLHVRLFRGLTDYVSGERASQDPRFELRNVACGTGHGWSLMFVNREPIELRAQDRVEGPGGYFNLMVLEAAGSQATVRFEGPAGPTPAYQRSANVDTVAGQGRAAIGIVSEVGIAGFFQPVGGLITDQSHA